MRSSIIAAIGLIVTVLLTGLTVDRCGQAVCYAEEESSGAPVGAKVMEIEGTAEATISGGAVKALKPGDLVSVGEKISSRAPILSRSRWMPEIRAGVYWLTLAQV